MLTSSFTDPLAPSDPLAPANPRRHSNKQIRQIANSIATFGFNVPLLVNHDLRVLAGHGRLFCRGAKMLFPVPSESPADDPGGYDSCSPI